MLGKRRFEVYFLPYFGPLALVGLLYTCARLYGPFPHISLPADAPPSFASTRIIIIFASQATRVLDNIGPVFRTMVPMCLYFAIMWTGACRASLLAAFPKAVPESTFFLFLNAGVFILFWRLSLRAGGRAKHGYKMAVTQAFTGAGNNFEGAIAVCIAIFGADSDQALAATIGPLVEVPVLLALTWVALYLERRLHWGTPEPKADEEALSH